MMKATYSNKNRNGFILVTVLLMIVALSLIGITGMIVSSNEVMIAGYINKSKEAFYLTEAALEEVKYRVLNDPTKGRSTSVGVGTLTDTSQNWGLDDFIGMSVVDLGGNIYSITSNNANTLTLATANTPIDGTYFMAHIYPDRGINGINGLGTVDLFTVSTANWVVDEWSGCVVVDSASTEYNITGNTAIDLTLNGTPANGDWEIICNLSASDSMTLIDPAYTQPPDYIYNDQAGWILIDSNNNTYNIDDTNGFLVNAITLENGAGTPANGDIVVARPGWMYDVNSPLLGDGATSIWTTTYTIGSAIGTATVTIDRVGTTKGSYTITSVGNIARATKAIQMSITDTGNGDAMFKNWEEITPP